jgi:hypothetical protein
MSIRMLFVHRLSDEWQCNGVQVCCEVREVKVAPARERPPPGSCGVRGGSLNSASFRMFSEDKFTQFGEFPWMLGVIVVWSTQSNNFFCGASLIHPQVALTTASCVSR